MDFVTKCNPTRENTAHWWYQKLEPKEHVSMTIFKVDTPCAALYHCLFNDPSVGVTDSTTSEVETGCTMMGAPWVNASNALGTQADA